MKKSLFTIVCTLFALFSFGQSSSEYGLSMGFSGYLGDLQSPNYTYQDPGFLTGFCEIQSHFRIEWEGFS